MNLYLRLIRVLLTSHYRGPLDIICGESLLPFRVHLTDLDMNMHMNNGRYFTLMDLGRMDLVARTGLLLVCLRKKWMPVLGAAKMNFMRPLGPLQKYILRTRLVGWDEKWFYIEQSFETKDGKIAAIGTVKGLFRSKEGSVPTALLFEELDLEVPGTAIPMEAQALRAVR